MITAIIPFLVLLVGLIMYLASSNGKVVRLGEIMFFVGLFISTWPYMKSLAHLP